MADIREARIMNVRQFRAEMPDDQKVIVMSKGVIKGSWTPGTEGISPETLAQVMGLVQTTSSSTSSTSRATGGIVSTAGVLDATATTGTKVSGPAGTFGTPAAAPKPKPAKR